MNSNPEPASDDDNGEWRRSMSTGWVCPKCGQSNGPDAKSCTNVVYDVQGNRVSGCGPDRKSLRDRIIRLSNG